MTDILQTRLNGTPFSNTSCSWLIAGAPYIGITAINYEEKRERALIHGQRKDGTPLGITSGKYSVGAVTMTMLTSTFQRLAEQLTILGLGSYGDAIFPIIATYSETRASLAGEPPVIVDIQGCRITGIKNPHAEGFEGLMTEVEMMAMTLSRNGLRLWSVINGLGV
jgi:hypothetical protein